MAAWKYLVPALAVVGHAAAASCSTSATLTVSAQSDATALAGCQTFTGSIAIATGTTDSIALDGIQEITGDLSGNGTTATGTTSLSSDSLSSIGGSFTLFNLIHLTTLNFPKLTSVNIVNFQTLPNLRGLTFQSGLSSVSQLTVSDTSLISLAGISPQQVSQIDIVSNKFLTNLDLPLETVSDELTITANLNTLTVSFPNLVWASNLLINDVASLSLPALSAINNTAGFNMNGFQSLYAPNLTTVGQTLAINDHTALNNLSMPMLQTITNGALSIENNTALMNISGFPALQHVDGAITVVGSFDEIDFPALNYVRGTFEVVSTGNINASCTTFDKLDASKTVILGTYTCSSNAGQLPTGTNSAGGSSSGGSGSSGSTSHTPSSGAQPMFIPYTGLLGVVAAIFGML